MKQINGKRYGIEYNKNVYRNGQDFIQKSTIF